MSPHNDQQRQLSARVIHLRRLTRYGLAAGCAVGAVLVRLGLDPLWGPGIPYITFFPAIMLSAWLAGLWPGVLTTVLTATAALYFWVDPRGSFVAAHPGELIGLGVFVVVGVLISVLNESWRAQAIEATRLHDSERASRRAAERTADQLAIALEAGRMGTWEYSLRTGLVKWSPGLEAIHGYAPGTFPGTFEAFRNEIHPDDRDRVLQAIADAARQRRDHHIEYRIVRADGAVRWVEGRGQVFLDDAHQPDRMVGVCSDITERRLSDERFRLAVEAAPAAMLMVDERGTIVLANALTEQLLGYTHDEIMGQPVDVLVPQRLREHHSQYRKGFLAEPRQRPMGAGRELFALRKDGSEVPVEIGLSPLQTHGGTFVLAAVTDITARKQVEYERMNLLVREQAARAETERASRLKDEFLAVLSHELRTPLNAVIGYAHLLGTGTLPPDRARHAVQAIQRNAQAQARLVESLLDLSRIMAGKLELSLERLDIAKLAEAAVDVVRPEAAAKGIALDVVLPGTLPGLVGDGGRLQQVLWNLLSNAIKFTPQGGASVFAYFPTTARWPCRLLIPAKASPRPYCRTCSTDSNREMARKGDRRRDLGWDWRWFVRWSTPTGGP